MVISTSVILAKLSAVWTINARICKGSGTHDSDKSLLFRCLRHCRRLALLHCAGRCDLLRTAWAKPLRSPGIRRCLIAAAWIVEVSLNHVDGALMVASHLFDDCEVYLGGAWIELPVRSTAMKIAHQPNH